MPAHTSQIRVRNAETDKMAIVYYANYFVWFEVARCDLLRSLGYTYAKLEEDGLMLPVISAQCDYLSSAHYDETLDVLTHCEILSPVRIEFSYDISRSADGGQLATGKTMHAAVDLDGHLHRLPDEVQKVLA